MKENSTGKNGNDGYVLVLIAGVLWGTTGLFVKALSRYGADAGFISFGRLVGAFLFLLAATSIKSGIRSMKIEKEVLIYAALAGIIGRGIHNIVYTGAIEKIGMSYSAVLMYLAPWITAVISACCFKEKITTIKAAALILNLLGCYLTVTGGSLQDINLNKTGVLMGICTALCYSLDGILGRVAVRNQDPIVIITWTFFFAALFVTPVSKPWLYADIADLHYLLCAAGYSLISTTVPHLLFYMGLSIIKELNKVPVIASTEMITATILGIMICGEAMSKISILGIILMFISIIAVNMERRDQ